MLNISIDINKLIQEPATDPDFPYAPLDWTREDAVKAAQSEGLQLTEAHWEFIRALQSYYAHHDDKAVINLRDLNDALHEHFHFQGGLRYLYSLFPGGPVNQGCRLGGLKAPFIVIDRGFGSVS